MLPTPAIIDDVPGLPVVESLVSTANLKVCWLGLQPYALIWQAMIEQVKRLLDCPESVDQLWLLHHEPVYTLGARGLKTGLIGELKAPVVKTDRGGDVTYHGPGQLIGYPLVNLQRLKCSGASFVHVLEQLLIDVLAQWGLHGAIAEEKRPGVYFQGAKLSSVGLRCKRKAMSQASYHGFALNLAMDLEPFKQINPCGYAGQRMGCVNQYASTLSLPSPSTIKSQPLAASTGVFMQEAAQVFAHHFTQWHHDRLNTEL